MPSTARVAPGGMVFHVLNRGVGRRRIFDKDADYAAFEAIVEETLNKCPMRICAYCWMPNHWHFVLWPEADDHLAAFMQRLSVTHVTRWQKHRRVVGEGHVYQGRFKSFPIETEDYFYQERKGSGLIDSFVQKTFAAGVLSETRHLYYTEPSKWQVIEERTGTSPGAETGTGPNGT